MNSAEVVLGIVGAEERRTPQNVLFIFLSHVQNLMTVSPTAVFCHTC